MQEFDVSPLPTRGENILQSVAGMPIPYDAPGYVYDHADFAQVDARVLTVGPEYSL